MVSSKLVVILYIFSVRVDFAKNETSNQLKAKNILRVNLMISRINKDILLFLIWLLVLACVITMTFLYNLESTNFYGIAETKELVANSENSVEINRINVVEGQFITKGQLLVELSSPELRMKINHISHQRDQLKAQKGVSKAELKSKIDQLKAENASKRNEINSQIMRYENQVQINKKLTLGLKSITTHKEGTSHLETSTNNPIQLRIESLRKELALALNPLNIQIELYQKELDASDSPIKIQIERLEKELAFLSIENNKLNIYSQISGVIGSINYKEGEKAEPFAPILTLHTKNPLIVKGFIHENVYNKVIIGAKVKVSSVADGKKIVGGLVVGVGSRIVEYPVRLRRHPDLQVWGREIIIKIPGNNSFILGEKVMIDSANHETSVFQQLKKILSIKEVHAQNENNDQFETQIDKGISIIIPDKTKHIEASGLLYLEDIDQYLVVSDDTPKDKPILFLMNKEGQVIKEATISGLSEISDIESITSSKNGIIYIASSVSANKRGKIKKSRRLLIAVSRDKDTFTLIQKIDLYSLFERITAHNPDKQLVQLIRSGIADKSIDIEGMFYDHDAIYLGLKSPLLSEKSVILKIDRISGMQKAQKPDNLQISIWHTFQLKDKTSDVQERISDLYYENGQLYITGSVIGKKSGSLWKFDEDSRNMTRLITFETLQPEGITRGRENGTVMICFDQGRKQNSKITFVKVAQ